MDRNEAVNINTVKFLTLESTDAILIIFILRNFEIKTPIIKPVNKNSNGYICVSLSKSKKPSLVHGKNDVNATKK